MARAVELKEMIGQTIDLPLEGSKEQVKGVVIQAWKHGEDCVRLQVKIDGTDELAWFESRSIPPPLPNAPREQTCGECGRRAKRVRKTSSMATYRCSAGHQTLITIGVKETKA